MDRKEFLSTIGLTSTSLLLTCLGCSKGNSSSARVPTPPISVDFSIDLTAAANASLAQPGGYMAMNGVLVAHTTAGNYIAVQQSCTHENYPLVYQASVQHFYCANHSSNFSESGAVLGGPANSPLTVFKTALTGNSLRVYS